MVCEVGPVWLFHRHAEPAALHLQHHKGRISRWRAVRFPFLGRRHIRLSDCATSQLHETGSPLHPYEARGLLIVSYTLNVSQSSPLTLNTWTITPNCGCPQSVCSRFHSTSPIHTYVWANPTSPELRSNSFDLHTQVIVFFYVDVLSACVFVC